MPLLLQQIFGNLRTTGKYGYRPCSTRVEDMVGGTSYSAHTTPLTTAFITHTFSCPSLMRHTRTPPNAALHRTY
jgi:hypothetical protein